MYRHLRSSPLAAIVPVVLAAFAALAAPVQAQDDGTVRGTVTLTDDGGPVHGAVVLIVGTGQFGLTAEDGSFEIVNVAPGSYEVLAQREHLTAGRQMITLAAGGTAAVDFELGLSPVHEDVTVTASAGGAETTFEAFNSVATLDSFDLVGDVHGSLGDALQREPGIASRSFGPGSTRPVIRGFDGDRVLILEDGIRTGDLSSQSGDHGVTIDPNSAERIEIVRGPATLLYGSNAVGGLVNIITPHESYRDSLFEGTRAQFSADAGSANEQAGTNASLQHAQENLLFWAGGSVRRTGDYDTPEGTVANSATELTNARAGIGYFGDRFFASGGVTAENGRYGVPFAGEFHGHHEDEHDHDAHGDEDDHGDEEEAEIDLDSRRRVGRFDIGVRNLNNPVIDQVSLSLNVIDWHHDELEIAGGMESVGTRFDNRTYVVRADVEQKQTERLSGRFGAWTQVRDFEAVGAEALAPQTDLASFAAFAYEELSFGRFRLQFGGRVERNDYRSMERTGGHDHGDDDHDHDDDHDDDDHDDDHGDDDHDDDHGDDDHDDDHGDDDHDDDHGDDDHDDDHGDDDHDDDHGDDDHDDDHGDDDHDDDHGDDDHDDDHGDDDHDDHGDDDHDDHGDDDDHDDHGDDDDHDDHDHDDDEEVVIVAPDPRDRDFVGASASIGLHADLGSGNAFVANLTQSHRAPALEELYNYGPHVGNLAFEVGNPDLDAETTLGLDVSLRHQSDRVRGNFNFFVYDIDNFIYGDRTDHFLDNLSVYNFIQGDSRFRGFDAQGSVRLAGRAWATLGLGYVDARLTAIDQALPRIPPLRGTLSLDIPYRGFTVSPELMFAAKQDNVYRGETETEGYVVADIRASYVWPRQHTAHILTFTAYNLTNELYRNHNSFIKDLAAEMGRGFKVGYSVRFF